MLSFSLLEIAKIESIGQNSGPEKGTNPHVYKITLSIQLVESMFQLESYVSSSQLERHIPRMLLKLPPISKITLADLVVEDYTESHSSCELT